MNEPAPNENRPEPAEAHLLAEALHDDWDHGAPSQWARAGATLARRRRSLRHVAVAGVTGAMLVLAGAGGAWALRAQRSPAAARIIVEGPAAPSRVAQPFWPAPLDPRREHPFLMTDAEALEALRGQPLLILPQPDGSQRIILLARSEIRRTDGPEAARERRR